MRVSRLLLPVLLAASTAACGRPAASRGAGDSDVGSRPSKYGLLTSSRWAYGAEFRKEDLKPVANTNPYPEPRPGRDHPLDLVVTPDGKKVYITLPGTEARPGHEVAVFDVEKRKIVKRIPVGSSPWSIAAHPGGRFLVVLNRFSNYASVIDTASDETAGEIPLDFYCMKMIHNKAGTRAYVSNRYLNQILVLDVDARGGAYRASVRPLGGFDETAFLRREPGRENLHQTLTRSCGSLQCHGRARGGFYAGIEPSKAFFSALENSVPGDPAQSMLLRAALPTADGGFADDRAGNNLHAGGRAVWRKSSPDYRRAAGWIAAARQGPGIPVGNFGSKPYSLALSSDERRLFVGNQGTQDISVVDLERNEEATGIYTQNIITDLKILRGAGRDRLIALSMGLGFGAAKERDPYGGETADRRHAAAQFTMLRDTMTTEPLPLKDQEVLGPFDAVDGTAASKMSDIQNDIIVVDTSRLRVPPRSPDGVLSYAMRVNRYEAHADWVRYTSDSAEVLPQDMSGDIPPELQRVVGAFPESLAAAGDRVFVVMLGTYELVEYRLFPRAGEPSELLEPVAVYPTGIMPRRVALGPPGTPAQGLAFVSNTLGETLSVIDTRKGGSREYAVRDHCRPFPDTNAERGEMFVNTCVFSADRDTSCMSCHIYDTSDARGWGAGQAIAQMRDGKFVNGGLLGIPQIKNLFAVQPFYFEGTHTAFAGQFDDAREHVPLQAFTAPNPQGDFTSLRHPAPVGARRAEHEEIQDKMSAASWGPSYLDLEERRDELIRRLSMRYFGKAFDFRDFQRFIGEFQAAETRLMPNPFDQRSPSVARGRLLFNDLAVGCVACHKPPHFTDKSEALTHNKERVLPPLITFTPREASFTLVGPHYMDTANGYVRDLEGWEPGGIEKKQGLVTPFSLRGLFDRPFVFLHHGRALSLRETFAAPDHYSLRKFKYSPLSGGEPVRPGAKERGFNELSFLKEKTYMLDTHGATSHLHALQMQDLENFLLSIE